MNRLIGVTAPGIAAGYTYDGDGKRASKTVSGATTPYLYDIKASVPKLLEDGERRYVWRPTLAYATSATSDDLVHVYHTDGIDSARVLTNPQGVATDVKWSDAFGVVKGYQGPSTQPFGFAGEQRDAETGLQYHRVRYYDPALGRFIQRDPLLVLRSAIRVHHRYVYTVNNPIAYIDPSGLEPSEAPSEVSSDFSNDSDNTEVDQNTISVDMGGATISVTTGDAIVTVSGQESISVDSSTTITFHSIVEVSDGSSVTITSFGGNEYEVSGGATVQVFVSYNDGSSVPDSIVNTLVTAAEGIYSTFAPVDTSGAGGGMTIRGDSSIDPHVSSR